MLIKTRPRVQEKTAKFQTKPIVLKKTGPCLMSDLHAGPDVVDEGARQEEVDDEEHHQAEDVEREAAELLLLTGE